MQRSPQIFINVEFLSVLIAHPCTPSQQGRRTWPSAWMGYDMNMNAFPNSKGYGDEFKTSDSNMQSCIAENNLKLWVRNDLEGEKHHRKVRKKEGGDSHIIHVIWDGW